MTFAFAQKHQVTGASVDFKLVSRLVMMPNEHSIFIFNFDTYEALFDQELSTFEQIVKSFHSSANEDFSSEPK